MKYLGVYYSKSLKTIILGFMKPTQERYMLHGRVIGHSDNLDWPLRAFNVGYEYKDWDKSDFLYIGRYTTFTTLDGYMSFLKKATTEQIEGYFKCKDKVIEYMGSYVVFKRNNGMSWYERNYKNN